MASHTIFSSESDEDTWIIQINHLVSETNLTILSKMPVCIYQVPKSLSCAKPEAFTPQIIAIGPYNHFRPELYPMERFKILSAKRVLDHFNKHDLKQLVEKLNNTGPFIRACYHQYLDLKEETLLYTMAIDGLFLLDFFHSYLKEKVAAGPFFNDIEQQVQTSGVKLTKDAIIRDVIMVENQIPTFILKMILVIESSETEDSVEEYLGSMLLSFCEKHCAVLKLTQTPTCSEAFKHCHLLDLLYHLIVSEHEKPEKQTFETEGMCKPPSNNNASASATSNNALKGIVTFLKKVKVPFAWIKDALKKLKDTNIPLLEPIKKPIDAILRLSKLEPLPSEMSNSETEAPVVIAIPSVCELFSIGIRFKPSESGIKDIHFDEMKGIFYLPVIKLDVNSEVIMRNIVAYEALTQPDSLIFTRYTELMRGIIDTAEDVKLLKKAQIIEKTSSLSVEETTDLFNGMSKSIGPTKTKKLDETIEKLNKYFHDKRKGNLYWIFTNYVYSSWKFFTLLSTFVLLAMTALEALCTVYDCRSRFRLKRFSHIILLIRSCVW